jgi:hypothetical protein
MRTNEQLKTFDSAGYDICGPKLSNACREPGATAMTTRWITREGKARIA